MNTETVAAGQERSESCSEPGAQSAEAISVHDTILPDAHAHHSPAVPQALRETLDSLTEPERVRFKCCLKRAQELGSAWYELGMILAEIRDQRLYREDYKTFEDFCRVELGMTRANQNRRIQTSGIARQLATFVAKVEKESHIRPLVELKDEEQQIACYRRAREYAEQKDRPLRASDVIKAVRELQSETSAQESEAPGANDASKADIITAITRAMARDLEKLGQTELLHLQSDLEVFKRTWIKTNARPASADPGNPAPADATAVVENEHTLRGAGASTDAQAAITAGVNKTLLTTDSRGNSKAPTDSSYVNQGEEEAVDAVPAVAASEVKLPTVHHKFRRASFFDAIVLELPADMSFDDLRRLRVNWKAQASCVVLLRLNGNAADKVNTAIHAWNFEAHGAFTIKFGSDTDDTTDQVLVGIKGHSKHRDQIPKSAEFIVPTSGDWFGPIVEAIVASLGEQKPTELLFMDRDSIPALLRPLVKKPARPSKTNERSRSLVPTLDEVQSAGGAE